MIRYENECCGCDAPGYPCRGRSCPLLHVPHLICDGCGDEFDLLYRYVGTDLCEACLLEIMRDEYGIGVEDEEAVEGFLCDEGIREILTEEVEE